MGGVREGVREGGREGVRDGGREVNIKYQRETGPKEQ